MGNRWKEESPVLFSLRDNDFRFRVKLKTYDRQIGSKAVYFHLIATTRDGHEAMDSMFAQTAQLRNGDWNGLPEVDSTPRLYAIGFRREVDFDVTAEGLCTIGMRVYPRC